MKLWRAEKELKEDKSLMCLHTREHSHMGGRQKQPHKNRKLLHVTVRETGLGILQGAEMMRVSSSDK